MPITVHPMRIELISSEPESGILSIELRVHSLEWRKSTNNLLSFLTKRKKYLQFVILYSKFKYILSF